MDFSPVRHIPAKNDNVSEYLLNFRIISMAAANHAAEGRQPVKIVINVSSMNFYSMKIIELPLRSRTEVLRRAPGEIGSVS